MVTYIAALTARKRISWGSVEATLCSRERDAAAVGAPAPGCIARMLAECAKDSESYHLELVTQEQGSMQLLRFNCL